MATTSPAVWTLFVGPFVGAVLAFGLARFYDANRRFKERLAAGNLALLILRNQYNDFIIFRHGVKADCIRPELTGSEPEWSLVRPNFISWGEYEFDYESIAFLFERGDSKTFNFIEEAQMLHRDLVQFDKHRTETARKTQQIVSEASKGEDLTASQAAKILGPAYIAELDMLSVGLAIRADDREPYYLNAFKTLRSALRDEIKMTLHYRLGYLVRFRHDRTVENMLINLQPRLDEGYNADELPEWPELLQERVSDILANRQNFKRLRRPTSRPVAAASSRR